MKKRPIGITILSILHFLGGIGTLIVYFLFSDLLKQISGELGFSSIIMVASVSFLGLLAIVSAIGMWLGKRWGWWLGAFYYIYAVARYGSHIVTVLNMSDQLVNSSRGVGYWIIKDILRIIINGLIFLYFFKNNVREYFKITKFSRIKAILILVGVIIGIFLVTFLVNTSLTEKDTQYSEEIVVINDTIIDQGDVYTIIEPLLWDVDLYSNEIDYNKDLKNYSVEQKYVFAIFEYASAVNNDGHKFFYLDYSGIVWEDAMEGFQQLGMTEYFDIIKESVSRFGENPSKSQKERQYQLEKLNPQFDDLDERFFQLEEDKPIEEALIKFIKDYRDKFYYNGIIRKPIVQ